MTEDKTQGTVEELKGRGREALGDLTGNEDQKAKGQAEKGKGKTEKVVGDVKNTINDVTDGS